MWRERDLEELGPVEEILRADDPLDTLVANRRTMTRKVEMWQPAATMPAPLTGGRRLRCY